MNGFGTMWRIPTHKHIRTMRSISKSTTEGRSLWPRLQETEHRQREVKRLRARRQFHERRAACRTPLRWR
jgi:hypothetical protein